MSLFTDAAVEQDKHNGLSCSVRVALDAMDEQSRADAETAMRRPLSDWSHQRVCRTINGMRLDAPTLNPPKVGHHRRGQCRCGERLIP